MLLIKCIGEVITVTHHDVTSKHHWAKYSNQ